MTLSRSSFVVAFVMLAACAGDDGVRHLADAPVLPDQLVIDVPMIDAPGDMPIDAPGNVDLMIAMAGNGGGRITSLPAGIDCGATCTFGYPPDTIVMLTAEPDVGSVFTGWGGACSGTSPTCSVTLAALSSVTATFTLEQYTVTVNRIGLGTGDVTGNGINCGSTCTTVVDHGTAISLAAAPTGLSNFIGWGGPCSGTGACATTITADTTITAAFALNDITLMVTRSGNGTGSVSSSPAGITCGVDCDETYVANTMVTLTAAPSTGSTFTGWSGAGCVGTAPCTITMTAAVLVTATFTLDTYQLTVNKGGNGLGTVTSTSPGGIACGGDCDETYDHGTMITLDASAMPGSTFTGWSGGSCGGTGSCVVTLTAATTVTATFMLDMYPLTVATAGTGMGTIASTPVGIACPTDCSQNFNHGQMINLSATPAVGSTFAGWSGACSGMGACIVSMTAPATVMATFTLNTYPVSAMLAGNGAGTITSNPSGITCPGDCNETFSHGDTVTFTPVAMTGSTFTGWAGACTGMGACVVSVTAASMVTATFTLNMYALNVSGLGTGSGTVTSAPVGINCGGDCTENYNHSQMVILTPSPDVGSTFTSWGGACSGSGSCIVTMTAVTSVSATFTLDTHTLTVNRTGTGTGTVTSVPVGITCGVDCSEIYDYGQPVTLAPVATTGSTFTGWSGACTGIGPCAVTITADTSVTANFTINTYTLTASTSGTGSGAIVSTVPAGGINCGAGNTNCTEDYTHGTMVTLTANQSVGSTFGAWGGACLGTVGTTCTTTMTAAASVSASFTINSYTLTASTSGTGSGAIVSTIPAGGINCGAGNTNCTEPYTHGTVVTLTANQSVGSTFGAWGGACLGTVGTTCMTTMTAAASVSASFTINTYTLTASTSGTGSGVIASVPAGAISCGAGNTNCTEDYTHGTVVTLTATQSVGSTFGAWGGACLGTVGTTCMTTMTAAASVSASFTINTYTLSASTTGTGSGVIASVPAGAISCGAGNTNCMEDYTHGTVVTLTATQSVGSTFGAWGGACLGTVGTTCMTTMTAAASVSASFTINTYTLTASTSGTGSGVIASVPAGAINCGAGNTNCTEPYTHGTVVTLTANQSVGSTFGAWGGACLGTVGTTCMTTMTAAASVSASFTINTYTLTASTSGTGSGVIASVPAGAISCGAGNTNCTEDYTHGTVVTLTATQSVGSTFGAWGGACLGTVGTTCMTTMTAAASVSASFTINTYTLSASTTGTGSGVIASVPAGAINCGAGNTNCTENYTHGTVVTLTATQSVGSTFGAWGGACLGTVGTTCMTTMTGMASVTASFSINTYTLTASTSGTGSGAIVSTLPMGGINCGAGNTNCTEDYAHGTMVTLSANQSIGSTFGAWGGACLGTIGTSCTISMTAAASVSASFTLNSYVLTVTKNGTGFGGTVTTVPAGGGINCGADCMETLTHGSMITLAASPAVGSVFAGWSHPGCTGLGNCTVTMTATTTVTATFNVAMYSLTVTNTGTAGGTGTIASSPSGISCGSTCTFMFAHGVPITLNATPSNAAYQFVGWSGAANPCPSAGYGACSFTITGNTSVTGSFSHPNVMFVTTASFGGSFGIGPSNGLVFADATCQTAASNAGLVGTTPGRNSTFRAWLSASIGGTANHAVTRMNGATGWARPVDHKPVFQTISDIGLNRIWYPPRFDQGGNDLGPQQFVWTGTTSAGLLAANDSCIAVGNNSSWTGTTSTTSMVGLTSANSAYWSSFGSLGCGTTRHLYCMGVDRVAQVGAPPVTGKRAFTSTATFATGGGIAAADTICNNEAAAAGFQASAADDKFAALLAQTTASAISRFTANGLPWVRVGDLQPITASETALYNLATVIDTAPNVLANGTRIGDVQIWTGSGNLISAGPGEESCTSWTGAGSKATAGRAYDTGMVQNWRGAHNQNVGCTTQLPFVCFER